MTCEEAEAKSASILHYFSDVKLLAEGFHALLTSTTCRIESFRKLEHTIIYKTFRA
jgi:hypothetical protein